MIFSLKKTDIVTFLLFAVLWIFFNFYSFATVFYNTNDGTPRKIVKRLSFENIDDAPFLISTPGCYIPNYIKRMKFKEAKNENNSCGQRAVFIKKISDDEISFRIDTSKLPLKYANKFKCCYQYIQRHTAAGKEDIRITYSECLPFKNGTTATLKNDHINVVCRNTKTKKIYNDAYMLINKVRRKNATPPNKNTWNVLVVGMDTMSRARFYKSMPETAKYLRKQGWLDYRGYHKVGANTFPNVMSLLTGKKLNTIYKACAKGMSSCNDMMIWSKFRKSGYATAYGEDFLNLPDTFSKYKGFKTPPTDHYTRPFFLTGETQIGNLVCTKTMPSAYHILNYALAFSKTYRNESSFGFFWLNSYSHNTNNLPTILDEEMVMFFEKLNMQSMGSLDNTFIFFLSDHGIRFGDTRDSVEAYYEERLPMLFIWIPRKFITIYSDRYYNLKLNQMRLTTPYDLHATLWNILQMSDDSIEVKPAEACPHCPSLFNEISPHRTCADVSITNKWCSCHGLVSINKDDERVKEIVNFLISDLQNKTRHAKTTNCHICSPLKLNKVLRVHYYVDLNTLYHVVAFSMNPENLKFEANIEEDMSTRQMKIIKPTYTISRYNSKGNCVINPFDRDFCVCERLKNCKYKRKL